MVTNIQPFEFIRRTNIKEHNALGDKINEIITIINNLNLDNVGTEIEQLQTEVSELNTDVSGNTTDITNLKSKVQQNTTDIAENTEMMQGLSSELPTSFALTLENDILTYRYNKEDGSFLDSNPVTMPYMTGDEATEQFQPKGNYETVTGAESKYQPKGDYETVSGAAGKYQPIGDYLTEVPIGGDVIGGIKNGGNVVINPDGTANASGQGTGIDSNVLTYANNKLKSTVNGVDSNEVEITGGTVDAYTKAESDAKYATKAEIPDVSDFVTQVELASDLADYMTADDVAAQYQVKGDYETVAGAAGKYQPIGNYLTEVPIGGGTIGGVKNGGDVTIQSDGTMKVSGGGSTGRWEKLDVNNLPNDFQDQDIILCFFKCYGDSSASSWSTAPSPISLAFSDAEYHPCIIKINSELTYNNSIFHTITQGNAIIYDSITRVYQTENWNNGGDIMTVSTRAFNGGGQNGKTETITKDAIATYVNSIYRMRV